MSDARIRKRGISDKPASDDHDFVGLHLIANYTGCDRDAIRDNDAIRQAMIAGALAAGATVLSVAEHVFPQGGLTLVLLLSESHASVHTYPEFCACFIDLFTCGYSCRPASFEAVMTEFLVPSKVTRRVWVRHHGIERRVSTAKYER